MKKISAVLLVLVLVGSVVFAGFTGSATTGFGYNLDSGAVGFITQSQAVSIDVTLLELLGEAKGEGDIYAEINATLSFSFNNADDTFVHDNDEMLVDFEIVSAKIIGDNWYVGILEALDAPNFAKSTIESKARTSANNKLGYAFDEDKTDWADVQAAGYFGKVAGVEVGYADYVASVGFLGNLQADPITYDIYGTLTTPEFELGDGLTLKAGVAGILGDANKAVSGSVQVAYEMDDLSVNVASDVVYKDELNADVALAAAYDVYSLDVYYATVESYNKVDTAVKNLLSAKATAVIDPVTVTVTGKDLVNKQDLGVSVKFQATDELAVTGRGGYVISTKGWNGGADVEYKTSDFLAKLGGTYRSSKRISLNASVESNTLVPGATLKLAYAGDDITEADPANAADWDNVNKGKVLASVKIAF